MGVGQNEHWWPQGPALQRALVTLDGGLGSPRAQARLRGWEAVNQCGCRRREGVSSTSEAVLLTGDQKEQSGAKEDARERTGN